MEWSAVDAVLAMGGSEPDGSEPTRIGPMDTRTVEQIEAEHRANEEWFRANECLEDVWLGFGENDDYNDDSTGVR